MRRRYLLIALILAAAAAGAVVAIVVSGDDDEKPRAVTTAAPTETATETATETEERTETATTGPSPAEQRNTRAVERTVSVLVEATEQGDGRRACAVIAGGTGDDIEACAARAGIDLRALPTSDEFSIDNVSVRAGRTAEARLSNGTAVSLRNLDGRWKIVRVRARAL